MLYGMIEQRVNEEYKTRSYLLAETFFIRKNEHFEKVNEVSRIIFSDWDSDNHYSPDHLSRTYFGELYWGDNIAEYEDFNLYIPTGKKVIIKRIVQREDIFQESDYGREDIGKEVEEEHDERLNFQSESTLVEYLWESHSIILKGYGQYYPSLKMGKSIGLKADPMSGKILDSDLKVCFHCIEFRDQFFINEFNYMRSDLLRKYMHENNLALLYQVKQHSYDEDYRHNRSMKYFILE